MLSDFKTLLEMSTEQPTAQRLLFLFASTEESNKTRKRDEKKGSIQPVMVVDKLPSEIKDFSAFVTEADQINKNWDFIFIASLGGEHKKPPSSEDAEPYLNKMTEDLLTGSNISKYVVFDRDENPIELSAT